MYYNHPKHRLYGVYKITKRRMSAVRIYADWWVNDKLMGDFKR